MTSLEKFSESLQSAYPVKKPFTGAGREAVDAQGKLNDLNQDGQLNLADALDDGQLSKKEYDALLKCYSVSEPDQAVFNQALAGVLRGNVPGTINFLEQVETLSKSDSNAALHFYGRHREGYERADVVTGQLQLTVQDRDGFTQHSQDDLALRLEGSLTVKTDLPKDLNLPPIASPCPGGFQFSVLGINLLSLTLRTQDKDTLMVVTPPSQTVMAMANKLGLQLPSMDEAGVAKMLGVPLPLVHKEGTTFTVSTLGLLKHKYPEGLHLAGQTVQLNTLDLSGLEVEDIQLAHDQATLKLKLNQIHLTGGTGSAETQGHLNETLTMHLAMKDFNLTGAKDMSLISSGQIELGQIAEELKKQIEVESKGLLKEVAVTWQEHQMVFSAKAKSGPLNAVIPVSTKDTTLSIDLSGLRVLGIPIPLAAARLNQYLSNTTPFQSRVQGNKILLDADELLVKKFPELAQTHRIESLDFQNGKVSFLFTRNPHAETALAPPKPQPPVFPQNLITPFVGATTAGDGVVGLSYTRAIPFGRSPIGRVLGLKPEAGTLPNLSYSYLDNTYSSSVSVATDGTFRGDVSTGLRVSANPVGLPVYAQVEPLGLGIAAGPAGTHAYLPMKTGLGYDNGHITGGVFYQHNFGLGGPDDNLLGVTGGLRW